MGAALIGMAMAGAAMQDKPEVTALPPRSPPAVMVPAPRDAPTDPRPINPGGWITAADYPAAARRLGAEGAVAMRLTVDPNGRVTECRIQRPSGNSELDAAACRLTAQRGRFEPARTPEGRAVAGTVSTTVNWKLQGDPPRLPMPGEMVLTFTVAPDGTASECSFTAQGGAAAAADPCKVVPKFAPRPQGQPQRVRMTNRVEYLDPPAAQ